MRSRLHGSPINRLAGREALERLDSGCQHSEGRLDVMARVGGGSRNAFATYVPLLTHSLLRPPRDTIGDDAAELAVALADIERWGAPW